MRAELRSKTEQLQRADELVQELRREKAEMEHKIARLQDARKKEVREWDVMGWDGMGWCGMGW